MPGGVPVYCDYSFQYRDIIVTFCLYFNQNTRFKPDERYANFVWGGKGGGVKGEHSPIRLMLTEY